MNIPASLRRILTTAFVLTIFAAGANAVTLVKDGKQTLTVLVDGALLPLEPAAAAGKHETVDAVSEQRHALGELIKYVKQMSGAELKLEAAQNGAVGCYVGLDSSFPWLKQDLKDLKDEGFIIKSDDKNLYLLAHSQLGVRQAVLTFLMEQGCRWFFAGDAWTVVPKKPTIEGTYNIRQSPSYYMGRTIVYGFGTTGETGRDLSEWLYHNRMGGPTPVSIGHTGYGIDSSNLKDHPEWFALVKGQRKASKVCYSNPEVIEKMTEYALKQAASGATSISLTPADGLGYCECDKCKAAAKGGVVKEEKGSFFATRPDGVLVCTVSETLFNAVNHVAKVVGAKYPNVILGCYGYSAYSHPPSFKVEPNVFVQVTTAYRRTPLSLEDQMDMWGKRANQVGIRGYWSVYQWDWDKPAVGKFNPETIQKDLQFYRKHNATAFNTEASNNWGPRGLSYYMGSQLLWNTSADVKALVRDFYEKAFGPAAKVMERYYVRWYGPDVAVIDPASVKVFAGGGAEEKIGLDEFASYNSGHMPAPKPALIAAFKDLDAAAKIVAGQPDYQKRVDLMRMYAYYLYLRVKVVEAEKAKDKAALAKAITNETAFGARLMNTDMIHSRALVNKAFPRLFKQYSAVLKDVPDSAKKTGTPPTHEELETLWAQGKKDLGA